MEGQQESPLQRQRRPLLATVVALTIALALLPGCDQKRPWGYFRIGAVKEVIEATAPETSASETSGGFREQVLADKWLVIRRDAGGLSAMSTLCTMDLNPLLRTVAANGSVEYESPYNRSRYGADGSILSGPTKNRLPFYKMSIDAGRFEGPKDTIYVTVGEEVSPETRLPLP